MFSHDRTPLALRLRPPNMLRDYTSKAALSWHLPCSASGLKELTLDRALFSLVLTKARF